MVDMRKVAPSRLSKRQRMTILGFKGTHTGLTIIAFAKLIGGAPSDILDCTTADCIRMREKVRKP